MRWIALVILCFTALHFHGEWRYSQGESHGRIDKYAETMQFIAGNRDARLAIVRADKPIEYHEAGTCVYCHT